MSKRRSEGKNTISHGPTTSKLIKMLRCADFSDSDLEFPLRQNPQTLNQMRNTPFIVIAAILVLIGCEKKNPTVPSKFPTIEKTAKDPSQPEYIRISASTFSDILAEKQGISDSKLSDAHWEMVQSHNESTVACYIDSLKDLEKSARYPSLGWHIPKNES